VLYSSESGTIDERRQFSHFPLMPDLLPQRTLGRSGLEVSAIGFGAAVIGDLYSPIEESNAVETICQALEKGITLIDTSPLYGHGLSEHRIGAALRHAPQSKVILSSKVGRVTDPFSPPNNAVTGYSSGAPHAMNFDYSREGTMRSLEQSLIRLGRDQIDLVLVHDLERGAHGNDYEKVFEAAMEGAVPALTDLREQGIIKAYGVGVNDADAAEKFVRNSDPDAVLLAGRYSLLEQPANTTFLPLAEERNIGVILGGVFNSGILATGTITGCRYNYATAPSDIVKRVTLIESICKKHGISLRTAALQFVFAHPSVSSVVLGAASPLEVEDHLNDFRHPIPKQLWRDLRNEKLIPPEVPCPDSS